MQQQWRMQGKCSPALLMVIVICGRWLTIALIYDTGVLQNNRTALCLNNSRDVRAPDYSFTFRLEEDQYITVASHRDYVLACDCCQKAGDLH